jgi:RND family efflux transporter MFP subunit
LAVSDITASVETFAEVQPRWSADIRAAVGGRILEVRETALAGVQVPAGAVLFQIESTQYATVVAAAELSLAEAKLALLRADNKTIASRRQFERDTTRAPNDLALHLPELRIAERGVASAEAQLRAAQQQLADTTITAPFSGFITERLISLGQTVSAGEPLLKLVDDKQFEMTAELSRESWALLDHPITEQVAQLVNAAGTLVGTAVVRQGGGFLDQSTRQYRVFLEVRETKDQPVLSGDFLRVLLTGRVVKDTLSIPDTALTRTGHVWFVDQNDQLMRLAPDIIFRFSDQIVIAAPEGGNKQRVAISPLASFLPGQRVAPHSLGH